MDSKAQNEYFIALGITGGTSPLKIFDSEDLSMISEPSLDSSFVSVNSCDFSPDGRLLAVGCSDSTGIRVFNTSDWSRVIGIPSQAGAVSHVKFSNNGDMLALFNLASLNRFRVYSTSDWSLLYSAAASGQVAGPLFSSDDSKIFYGPDDTAERQFRVVDTASWEIAVYTVASVAGLALSPHDDLLYVARSTIPSLVVLETETLTQIGYVSPSLLTKIVGMEVFIEQNKLICFNDKRNSVIVDFSDPLVGKRALSLNSSGAVVAADEDIFVCGGSPNSSTFVLRDTKKIGLFPDSFIDIPGGGNVRVAAVGKKT